VLVEAHDERQTGDRRYLAEGLHGAAHRATTGQHHNGNWLPPEPGIAAA
jgi:hypothetical protein